MPTSVTLDAFRACAIPLEEWDHRAHLTVAYLLLREHPLDEATRRMQGGVRLYNDSKGVQQTASGGYHDTLTIAWMRVVHTTMVVYGPGDDAATFLASHPHLLNTTLLRLFYSRPRIMSGAARQGWVEPDLAPLPLPPRA